MVRIVAKCVVQLAELIRVVRWVRDQREHFATLHIEDDNGASAGVRMLADGFRQECVESSLEHAVNRHTHVFTVLGLDLLDEGAVTIFHQSPAAAAQRRFSQTLHTADSDPFVGLVARERVVGLRVVRKVAGIHPAQPPQDVCERRRPVTEPSHRRRFDPDPRVHTE